MTRAERLAKNVTAATDALDREFNIYRKTEPGAPGGVDHPILVATVTLKGELVVNYPKPLRPEEVIELHKWLFENFVRKV